MKTYDIQTIYQWPPFARNIVIAAISILIFIFLYVIDISSYKIQIEQGIKQEADLKQQLQLMLQKQVTVKGNIEQLPMITALLQEWQQRILTKKELPDFLNNIIKAGQANHLKINSFNPANEIRDGIYYKTPVNMDMTGTYDEIARFISQLANMPKLVSIDAFLIRREIDRNSTTENAKPLNSDDVLTAKLDIEIYRK